MYCHVFTELHHERFLNMVYWGILSVPQKLRVRSKNLLQTRRTSTSYEDKMLGVIQNSCRLNLWIKNAVD